jgi:hypothetical protein
MNKGPSTQEQLQRIARTSRSATSLKLQAVLILGMHRSGTSAIGGAVSALGVAGPKTLLGPNCYNSLGYFESAPLTVAHDELLASAGSNWDDWRQINPLWIRSKSAEQHRQKIKAVLIEEFGDKPLIFVKDPRICRFIPFTLSILAELNISPVAILAVRNPLEVAYSLKRRDNFPLSKSMLLWLRYVLDAEFHSRQMPRCFFPYEAFLANWRYYADGAAEKTGVIWPDRSDRSGVKIDDFLKLDMRHERVSSDEFKGHSEVPPLVREAYNTLTNIATKGENKALLDHLDLIRNKFDEGCHTFGPAVLAEELAVKQSRRELKTQIAHAEEIQHNILSLTALLDQRSAEVHLLTVVCDALAAVHNSLVAERDGLVTARDSLISERDALAAAHSKLIDERDRLATARDSLSLECDALASAYDKLMRPTAAVPRSATA